MKKGVINAQMQKAPSLVYLLLGLFTSVFSLLLNAILPTSTWGVFSLALAFFCFLYQRFFLLGIALGIVAVYFNAETPYANTLKNCQFDAEILRANFSKQYNNKVVLLKAQNIICNDKKLPNQNVQFWDNKNIFQDYLTKKTTLNSELHPVRGRLNFSEFDYEKYLISQGIRLSVKNPKILKSSTQKNLIYKMRNAFSHAINNNLQPQNAAMILALVTGNRTGLTPKQKQTLKKTGTSHIIAISGLHLALLGGVAWLLGQCLWAMSWRLSDWVMPIQAGAVLAFFTISIYAALTGFEVPIKRAWVMYSFLIFSWLFLKNLSTRSLFLAAVFVIVLSPYSVLSVGFYFSFIATFIVLWCVQLGYPPIVKVLIMQALITITLMPITWYAFEVITISAFFVNLLIIPWLGFWVLPWAVLSCVLSLFFPALATPIWSLVAFSTSAMWQTIDFFSTLNWTLSPAFTPALTSVVIAVAGVLLALIFKKKWLAIFFCGIFLPLKFRESPTLIIADERYTSALIHNGKTAIIINPGRHYQNINQAQKWQRYLQQHGITLGAIILQNDKLSLISATKALLTDYPDAKVIALRPFETPYKNQYCTNYQIPRLNLETILKNNTCSASITWEGRTITLFNPLANTDNAILKGARLHWQNQEFNTKKLGAIKITYQKKGFNMITTRQKNRLWRVALE